jgi:hypothetical protein
MFINYVVIREAKDNADPPPPQSTLNFEFKMYICGILAHHVPGSQQGTQKKILLQILQRTEKDAVGGMYNYLIIFMS